MITHYFYKKPYTHGLSCVIEGGYVGYTQHPEHDRNLTIEEYQVLHPGDYSELMTADETDAFLEAHEKATYLDRPGHRITKADYWEMLECLPPMRWSKHRGVEFFFICEAMTSNIHSVYCERGDDYVSFYARTTDSADGIVTRAIEIMAATIEDKVT